MSNSAKRTYWYIVALESDFDLFKEVLKPLQWTESSTQEADIIDTTLASDNEAENLPDQPQVYLCEQVHLVIYSNSRYTLASSYTLF